MPLCLIAGDETRPLQDMVANVDCQVRHFAQAGYVAIAGTGSSFAIIITLLLTIYIAAIGYRMMLGHGPMLTEMPLLALKVGCILAFTLHWPLFQTVVFDVATDGGQWLAHIVQGKVGLVANLPLAGAEEIHSSLMRAARSYEAQAALNPALQATSEPSLASRLRGAARMELFSTAGIQSVALLLTGVLTVIGPVFIAFALFEQSRGLFVGWLRLLLIATFLPLLSTLSTMLMLRVVEPTITTLNAAIASGPHAVAAAEAAIVSVQLFALAQASIVIGVLIMVSGFDIAKLMGRRSMQDSPLAGDAPPLLNQSRVDLLSDHLRHEHPVQSRTEQIAFHSERRISAGAAQEALQPRGVAEIGFSSSRRAKPAEVSRLVPPL